MLKHIPPAFAAALGTAIAFSAIINFLTPPAPGTAGVPPAPAVSTPALGADALPGPAGWRHYRVTFAWTAPAADVFPSISQDGQTWTRCGVQLHAATNGINTIYLLLPESLLADAASPCLRIGTADRRYGFTTALPNPTAAETR
jgi:hypothetical protein